MFLFGEEHHMTDPPDTNAVLDEAVRAVESRYGVTIQPEAREVLVTWARSNADQIADKVKSGWTEAQFVDAARQVLEAAAVYTLNPPGIRYEVEPDGLVRERNVSSYATLKVLPNNCPFFGC